MKQNQPDETLSKKDQLIGQAFEVFYKNGFHASGLELLLDGTGISKRTMYKYFDSKEDLIAATVTHYTDLWDQRIMKHLSEDRFSAEEKIMKLFEVPEERLKAGTFQGCYAMKAKLEYNGKHEGIETNCSLFFDHIEGILAKLCKECGSNQPKKTASQISLLFRGAILTAVYSGSSQAFKHGKDAVKTLLKDSAL